MSKYYLRSNRFQLIVGFAEIRGDSLVCEESEHSFIKQSRQNGLQTVDRSIFIEWKVFSVHSHARICTYK